MKKKASSREGTERRAEQFIYTPTPVGVSKAWTAHCAGEPYWCMCHEHTRAQPGTKVCVAWYTDGALICPRCRPAVVPSRIGYVPVWREIDHRPCLVIVHESVEDLLSGVGFGVRVLIGCVERGASVFVRPVSEQTRWVSEHPLRQRACDLTLSLYTIWAYPALATWDAEGDATTASPPKVNALTVPTESDTAVSLPHDRLAGLLDAQSAGLAESAERARRNAEFIRSHGASGSNGKPKPKG
jgi:hypothetical protein